MIRFKNLKEKAKKRLLRKRALSKMQLRGLYALKYIPKRKNKNLP
jgi:hypothetical protein